MRYILLDVISFAAGKGGAKLVVNPTLLAQLQQQVKDDLLKKQAAQQQQIKADQLEKEAAQQQQIKADQLEKEAAQQQGCIS